MSLTSFLSVALKVDWANDGSFASAGDDVSADARYPISTSRGRAKATDEFSAGTGSFRLNNATGDYTPLYASSPLYPNVLPGRPVLATVTYNSITYDLFKGRCTPESQRSRGGDPEMGFSMVDAFEQLRLGLTNTALQQGKRVDEIITAILDDIGWAAGDRSLDTGPETMTVFTNHNRLPINALQLAAKQDPGAALFMSRAGKVVYQNRYYRSLQPVYATLAGTFEDIDPQIRQEDMVDSVRATYPRFTVGAALAPVWSLSLPRWLPAGTGTFEFELNASGVLGATGYVTPLVATTDFTCNSALDGSGTDKTAQVSMTVTDTDSGGGTVSFTNLDSSPVALRTCQVRAYPLQQGEETNAVRVTVAAPIVTGQQLNRDFEFQDGVDPVTGWTRWQANVRGVMRIRPVVTIIPDTDALMAIVLGAEIGNRVALSDTGAPWLTQASGHWFIEGIDLEITGPASVKATWRLFDPDLAVGSMFRISGAAGAGADYSTIAAAGATSGDRIGF